MSLREYQRKRDFRRTSEPSGKQRVAKRSAKRFCIQEHAATRLHYDFRLEHDGVLKSWAVPKGPSLDPSVKRLAMHVEDHPIEYGSFEGTIPKGQYGGGTVLLWDRGHWIPEGDPGAGLRKGSLKFELVGEKLRGSWALVQMHGKTRDEGNAWLLIKEKDSHARPGATVDITRKATRSVASGRTLAEIAREEGEGAPKSKRSPAKAAESASKSKQRARKVSARVTRAQSKPFDGARRASMPKIIEPERATLVKAAPSGPQWVHEIKYDGYRAICRIERGKVRWFTRAGLDWTARFASLSPAMERLPVDEALIDGEVVVLRSDGTTSFQDLQQTLGKKGGGKLTFYAFDLLYLDGYDLRSVALEQRKEALAKLMRDAKLPPNVLYSDHLSGSGASLHSQACRHKLEGIVSKRRDQPYRSGRQRDWLKVKCALRQEFVVGGFTLPEGARSGLGALLVGVYGEGGKLRYSGRVGTGFDRKTLRELRRRLDELARDEAPFANPPLGARARGVRWVEPELVIEAEFTGWTEDGALRHPSFEGIREDKAAREVVLERALSLTEGARSTSSGTKKTVARVSAKTSSVRSRPARGANVEAETVVAGVRLTHPARVVYPEQGITKLALAEYYERVADRLLPHVTGRPLSIVRCPQGRASKCFYQKHHDDKFPEGVKGVPIRDSSGIEQYLMVDSLEGLIGLAQIGALELHPWGARSDDVDRPDRMFFDLDPSPEVAWPRVVEAARRLRAMLEDLGLESFVKTTGGKGLHVVVPLQRKSGWDEMKSFSKSLAERVVRESPSEYIATASKARRTGKIFIDYLRNGRGATAVAPYSTRALANAPVSMPIRWDALGPKLRSDRYTLSNVAAALRGQDPWRGIFTVRQSLTASMRKAVERRGGS
jgi:bifunctional non-homologous end joining protein LigD